MKTRDLLEDLNIYSEGKLSFAFLNALRVYRSPDDVVFSLEDQFRVIADRIKEDVPEKPNNPNPPYVVDGHEFENEDSEMLGDGKFPPFRIFDTEKQIYLHYNYTDRQEAEDQAARMNLTPEDWADINARGPK